MDCLLALNDAMAAGRPVAMATVVEAPDRPEWLGLRHLTGPAEVLSTEIPDADTAATLTRLSTEALAAAAQPGVVRAGGLRVYVEAFLPRYHLVVVGGGHVAQPIAQLGSLLGFAVTVIDDRPEYANRERFPTAEQVISTDFVTTLRALELGPRHHIVLITRGHRHDMDCLREVVRRPVAYIGMIGSRNRVQTVFNLLTAESGVDPALLESVYSPIGLDIGARTPPEIAVAVAAELIKVRHGGTGESLSRLGRAVIHRR